MRKSLRAPGFSPLATGAAIVAVALAIMGCGRGEGNSGSASAPGISDKEIKLGGSYPFSGPASAYGTIAKAAQAYFEYVNDKGGIDGRSIEFITLDDAYDPARALQNSRRLIQQEKVFALFNTLGTTNVLATWDYVNQQKVPQLFVASGSSEFGSDIEAHPWTLGGQPTYNTESKVYADYIARKLPRAKVAVLYQNDSFGKELLGDFEEAIDGTGVTVVAKEAYNATDPSVEAQVNRLARSGADVFYDVTSPKFAAQAIAALSETDWKPLHILTNVSASKSLVFAPVGLEHAKGIVSAAYLKEPEDPEWRSDPAVLEYRRALEKYAPRLNPNEYFNIYGWSEAQMIAKAIDGMKEPTRAALMESARNLDFQVETMIPGIRVQTSPNDGYPIQALRIQQFDGDLWRPEGPVIQAPGN